MEITTPKTTRTRKPNTAKTLQEILDLAISSGELKEHTYMCHALNSLRNCELITRAEWAKADRAVLGYLAHLTKVATYTTLKFGTLNGAIHVLDREGKLTTRGKKLLAEHRGDRYAISVAIYSRWKYRFWWVESVESVESVETKTT